MQKIESTILNAFLDEHYTYLKYNIYILIIYTMYSNLTFSADYFSPSAKLETI